jgi:3-oxoacyl-[acyl-carrier-protein] synthase III
MPEISDTTVPSITEMDRRLSGRSRMGSCLGVRIAATGSYVPDQIVTNEDLVALGCDSDWILQRTGILERRRAAAGQAASDMGYEAAIRCLANANVAASDVDLIVVATMTPDFFTPSTACLLQRKLGCIAPAMDINAACAGFMYAMVTAANFVQSGMAKRALVVGTEVMSGTINPSDIKTYPLFGDGAGAALIVRDTTHSAHPDLPPPSLTRNTTRDGGQPGLLAYTLGSEGCGAEMLCIPGGGSRQPLSPASIDAGQQYLKMDGRGVFKWAVRVVDDSSRDCMAYAGFEFSQVDLVLLHQANIRIIDSAVRDFGIPKDRVFVNLDKYGNTSAASIPLALDDANQQGRLRRGDHVLMCGFGAGLAWGTALMRW